MMESGSRLFFNPYHSSMFSLTNCDPAFPGLKSELYMALDSSKKRPFFSSPEDCFEDEYYDDQLSEKKRRLTPAQVNLLEKSFEEVNKLEPERKTQLANKLGLQPRQVAVWFQNRRARWKTKQLERDYDLLKASYDSLLSDYDSILTQHNKLKAEVAALTEKLQKKDAAVAKEPESFQLGTGQLTPDQLNPKVEDRLSSGTAASAVVDVDSQQLLDSGDSLIENNNGYSLYGITSGSIHSEDDEGSDNGRSYFSGVFVEAGRQHHEMEEPLEWWMWS